MAEFAKSVVVVANEPEEDEPTTRWKVRLTVWNFIEKIEGNFAVCILSKAVSAFEQHIEPEQSNPKITND
jgi:hypothetical protein